MTRDAMYVENEVRNEFKLEIQANNEITNEVDVKTVGRCKILSRILTMPFTLGIWSLIYIYQKIDTFDKKQNYNH